MSQTCGTRSTSTLAAPMATLLKTSRLHWNALSCESACPSYCMHHVCRIYRPVSGCHPVHNLSDVLICFTSLPHSMVLGPYACTSDQQDSVQQGQYLAFLPVNVINVSISMHTCVPAEVVCKLLCGFQPVRVGLVHMQYGKIFDAMLC